MPMIQLLVYKFGEIPSSSIGDYGVESTRLSGAQQASISTLWSRALGAGGGGGYTVQPVLLRLAVGQFDHH